MAQGAGVDVDDSALDSGKAVGYQASDRRDVAAVLVAAGNVKEDIAEGVES